MTENDYKELVIRHIVSETSDMKLFYFGDPSEYKISYKAGQYLTFVVEDTGKEFRRSYSLGSSPELQEPLYIGVKRIANGNFSRRLFDSAQPGDSLKIAGAGGVFTLPDDIYHYRQIFFFAAGSGILPIYSLIKTVLHSFPHVRVVLIYSNKSVESAAFYSDLNRLQFSFPQTMHIEFLFSNSEDLLRSRLHAELLGIFLESLAIDALGNCLYYMCGPEAYMRFCAFVLQGYHIPAENIKKEIFHTARPTNKIEPPDKGNHIVTIQRRQERNAVAVQYPTTILQAARNIGIDLPYSCEVGRCGNCMARCVGGKVWMVYNEVLTERELAKGMVLTCTGYPVSGDVELVFD